MSWRFKTRQLWQLPPELHSKFFFPTSPSFASLTLSLSNCKWRGFCRRFTLHIGCGDIRAAMPKLPCLTLSKPLLGKQSESERLLETSTIPGFSSLYMALTILTHLDAYFDPLPKILEFLHVLSDPSVSTHPFPRHTMRSGSYLVIPTPGEMLLCELYSIM